LNGFKCKSNCIQYIENKNLGNEVLFERKVLVLLVEIGELANQTRCFKFWSKKAVLQKSVILEEFVDGVHFILSIGIELGYDNRNIAIPGERTTNRLNSMFLAVYDLVGRPKVTKLEMDFEKLIQQFFSIRYKSWFLH